jgi:hypothetical protein
MTYILAIKRNFIGGSNSKKKPTQRIKKADIRVDICSQMLCIVWDFYELLYESL